MKHPFRACGALALALAAWTGRAQSPDGRFSQSLTPAEVSACGLGRLDSDQLASLDALVRTKGLAPVGSAQSFSQRLTPDEFRAAGLAVLTAPQRTRLDGDVAQSQARLAGPGAVAIYIPPPPGAVPAEATGGGPPPPEIHGSLTLGLGGGGGYSEKFGQMDMNYVDPAHGLAVAVGVGEDNISLPTPTAPKAAH